MLISILGNTLFVNETIHERIRFKIIKEPPNQSALITMTVSLHLCAVQLERKMTKSLTRICIRETNVTLKLICRAGRLS